MCLCACLSRPIELERAVPQPRTWVPQEDNAMVRQYSAYAPRTSRKDDGIFDNTLGDEHEIWSSKLKKKIELSKKKFQSPAPVEENLEQEPVTELAEITRYDEDDEELPATTEAFVEDMVDM